MLPGKQQPQVQQHAGGKPSPAQKLRNILMVGGGGKQGPQPQLGGQNRSSYVTDVNGNANASTAVPLPYAVASSSALETAKRNELLSSNPNTITVSKSIVSTSSNAKGKSSGPAANLSESSSTAPGNDSREGGTLDDDEEKEVTGPAAGDYLPASLRSSALEDELIDVDLDVEGGYTTPAPYDLQSTDDNDSSRNSKNLTWRRSGRRGQSDETRNKQHRKPMEAGMQDATLEAVANAVDPPPPSPVSLRPPDVAYASCSSSDPFHEILMVSDEEDNDYEGDRDDEEDDNDGDNGRNHYRKNRSHRRLGHHPRRSHRAGPLSNNSSWQQRQQQEQQQQQQQCQMSSKHQIAACSSSPSSPASSSTKRSADACSGGVAQGGASSCTLTTAVATEATIATHWTTGMGDAAASKNVAAGSRGNGGGGGGGGGGVGVGVGPPLIRYIRSWTGGSSGKGDGVPGSKTMTTTPEAPCDAPIPTHPTSSATVNANIPREDGRQGVAAGTPLFSEDEENRTALRGRADSSHDFAAPLMLVHNADALEQENDNDSSSAPTDDDEGEEDEDELEADEVNLEDEDEDDDEASWSFAAPACEGPRDWDFDTEWSEMPPLPHRFCLSSAALLPVASAAGSRGISTALPYLDSIMQHGQPTLLLERESNRFATEQGLFLQAVMQLLAERDQVGVEGSIHSDENIWKKGPLKKLTAVTIGGGRISKWKTKYVELRKGNLCYYEDSGPGQRKTIHIRQADTTVQECPGMSRSGGHTHPEYVFELCVQGSPPRYWMVHSNEERQAWIKAIQKAMMVGSTTENSVPHRELDLAPHLQAIKTYSSIRERIGQANVKEEYLEAVLHGETWESQDVDVDDDALLRVPVAWVRDQVQRRHHDKASSSTRPPLQRPGITNRTNKPPSMKSDAQKQLKQSISAFWTSMGQTTFVMNGITVPGESPRAPARVVGALTRSILEFDRAFAAGRFATETATAPARTACEGERASSSSLTYESLEPDLSPSPILPTSKRNPCLISELQAVSFARSILMAALRSDEEEGHFHPAKSTVQHLLQKDGLVRVVSSRNDDIDHQVQIEVSFPGDELPDAFLPPVSDEMAGWLWIRRPKQPTKSGRRRYAVLSGSVLSYYEHATPRPTGLRGQLLLHGAAIRPWQDDGGIGGRFAESSGPEARYELTVVAASREHDRVISFEDESDYLDWKDALQTVIDSFAATVHPSPPAGSVVAPTAIPEAVEYEDPIVSPFNNGGVFYSSFPPIAGANSSTRVRNNGTGAQNSAAIAAAASGGQAPHAPGSSFRRSAERVAQGVTERVMKGADGGLRGGIRVIKGAKDGGIKAIKSATDGSMKVLRGAVGRLPTDSSMKVLRGAVGRLRANRISSGSGFDRRRSLSRRPSMQVLLNNTALSGKRDEPTVQCVVQSTHSFQIQPSSSGEPRISNDACNQDVWLTVNVRLYQAFLMMGGPGGRMAGGDALIELDFDENPYLLDF